MFSIRYIHISVKWNYQLKKRFCHLKISSTVQTCYNVSLRMFKLSIKASLKRQKVLFKIPKRRERNNLGHKKWSIGKGIMICREWHKTDSIRSFSHLTFHIFSSCYKQRFMYLNVQCIPPAPRGAICSLDRISQLVHLYEKYLLYIKITVFILLGPYKLLKFRHHRFRRIILGAKFKLGWNIREANQPWDQSS